MRKVLCVTGIRSEYDILYPVLKAIQAHPKLSVQVVATGAHLSKNYGHTVDQIRKDGFEVAEEIESLIDGDQASSRIKGAAVQLTGLVQTVSRLKPDFLMVLGDREESITTALTGAYLGIPVAHLCGGDKVIGNVDDVVRHAVTKLASIHFTTNEESRQRVLRLGEEGFRTFNTGNPGLDRFLEIPPMSKRELLEWYGFGPEAESQPLLVVVQHVLSSEIPEAYSQMRETLEAVRELGYPTVLSQPNSDAGSQEIIRCIRDYSHLPNLKVFKNIPRLQFVNTLKTAACLIGNSSLGLLEAPFVRLPAINVGNRQKGRLHGENMIFVPHDRAKIVEAAKRACFDREFVEKVKACESPYGDGRSSSRIAEILASIEINGQLLNKEITY